MIKLKSTYFLLFVLLIFINCKTYDTFYGVTDTINSINSKSKRLDLSDQNLSKIPDKTNNLVDLRMLNLSGNRNLDIFKILADLPSPDKLEVLILDSLQLKELPINISIFKNLKQLSLGYNPDLNLQKTFNQLDAISLEFLNLKGNEIQQLPENIKKLATLKDLNLSFNHLQDEKSYDYLADLPSLYSLWIDHNELTQLPKTIKTLNQISYLYADNNQLNSLPEEISEMKNLRVFHLGYNNFKEFPAEFIKVPNLIMVHINNNQISSFSRRYKTEKYRLLSLMIDNNPISREEQTWAEETFKRFFLLSFNQEY